MARRQKRIDLKMLMFKLNQNGGDSDDDKEELIPIEIKSDFTVLIYSATEI